MGGKAGENPAALRAAVFSLSSKSLRGGGAFKPPPPAGRGLKYAPTRTTSLRKKDTREIGLTIPIANAGLWCNWVGRLETEDLPTLAQVTKLGAEGGKLNLRETGCSLYLVVGEHVFVESVLSVLNSWIKYYTPHTAGGCKV